MFPVTPAAARPELNRDGASIEMSGVRKSFGTAAILKGVDLRIASGEKVALIGHSGCGKSTLLRCINALEFIDAGELRVNGTDLSPASLKTGKPNLNLFRSRIGVVFQQFNLFPHLTVLENVTLGPVKVRKVPKPEAVETARSLLERVGIGEKAAMYPEQLSGGQKQRVAIARGLAMNPEIMLLDEPTSALDPSMTREVLSVIRDVAAGEMTLLIVTHEWRFIQDVADRVVFMHQGRVEEEGPPSELFNNPRNEATRSFLETVL